MSGLMYGLGGLGQGLTQGKQVQYQRGVQQQELGLKGRQVGAEESRIANEKASSERAQAMQSLQGMNNILQNPDAQDLFTPEELGKVKASRFGLLQAHPDLDFAGEVTAANDRQARAPQIEGAANAVTQDIFSQAPSPNQMLNGGGGGSIPPPTDTGNPSAPPAPPGLPPINGQPQAGPVLPAQPSAPAPPSPRPPTQATPDTSDPLKLHGSGNPDDPMLVARHFYAMAANPDLAPALRTKYWGLGMEAEQKASLMSLQGSQSHELDVRAAGGEIGNQYIAPEAEARIGGIKAGTAGTIANTAEVHPNAAAQRGLIGAETGKAKVETAAIPKQTAIAEGQLDIQRSGQRIAAFTAHANAAEAQRGMDLEAQKYGFTKREFEITKKGMIAQAGHTAAEAAKLWSDPDFNSQAIIKTIADNAYTTSPSGVKTMNGPTAKAYQRYLAANQQGNGPTLANPSMPQILGTGPTGGGGQFDLNGLMNDKTLSPSQKVQVLKRAGQPIPGSLAKQASAQMAGAR